MSRVALLSSLALVACGSTCATETPTPEPGPPLSPVGNNDPRGVDNQPDWEGMARELRVEMDARLPRPLPSDLRLACNEMLDAAARFYADTEPNPTQKAARAEELASTRAAELAACVSLSSIEAAICVRLRLDDRDSEFPWLLDQCSRAYPRAAAVTGEAAASERAAELELAFVGDVIFGRYRDDGFDPIVEGDQQPFAEIAPLLAADVLVANLETPVVEEVAPTSPIGSKYRFSASREHVRLLAAAGFDVVSLANNHYFDLRQEGQRETPRILGEEGILAVGASREEPPLFRVESGTWRGWKVGFLAVTTRRNAPARADAPELPYLEQREMVEVLTPVIEAARADHDLVIVAVHWGDEYAEAPSASQRAAAHGLVDAGADLVFGHHPHVLQAIESYRAGVIAYSMGNFLFENANEIPRLTGVLQLRFTAGSGAEPCLARARFEPAFVTRQPFPHPRPAQGGMAKRVRDRVVSQGKAVGAEWVRVEGEEALELAIPACAG